MYYKVTWDYSIFGIKLTSPLTQNLENVEKTRDKSSFFKENEAI